MTLLEKRFNSGHMGLLSDTEGPYCCDAELFMAFEQEWAVPLSFMLQNFLLYGLAIIKL
jgi:hypothetical protein